MSSLNLVGYSDDDSSDGEESPNADPTKSSARADQAAPQKLPSNTAHPETKPKLQLPSFKSLIDQKPTSLTQGSSAKRKFNELNAGKDAPSAPRPALVPPQVKTKGRSNVSTEDRSAWNTDKGGT